MTRRSPPPTGLQEERLEPRIISGWLRRLFGGEPHERRIGAPVSIVEEYEPRLLYSADAAALALPSTVAIAEQRALAADGEYASSPTSTPLRTELVVVDGAVSGHETLIRDLDDGSRRIEVLELDARSDGVAQVSAALAGRQDVSAVHIISHGVEGAFHLGATVVDQSELARRSADFAAWGEALTENADILLYGCDVAQSDAGRALTAALAALTGADVSASTDPTGAAALGGNWTLEHETGRIETRVIATAWQGLLQAVTSGSETRVNATVAPTQTEVAVAMAGDGSYVVVWSSGSNQDGNGDGIFAQRYDAAGTAQGGEFRVNTTTASDQRRPDVAMDANGNFVVVWASASQDGSGFGIYAQRYSAAGVAQGTEFRVNVSTGNDQDQPAVAMDSSGNFVVAWNSKHTGNAEVYARRFDAAGNPLSGELLVNTTTANDQDLPTIAMSPSGAFVIAWKTTNPQDGNGTGVFAQLYNASGSKVGGEFQVNTTASGDQDRPAAAMTADGSFLIAWVSGNNQDGDRNGVFAQRFSSLGVKQGGEFRVNTTTQNHQDFPSIAIDSAGNFTVAWESSNQDGSGTGVYLQQYDATGFPLGFETRVNTTTASDQLRPVLGMRPTGDFVIAWSGNGPADTAGVFAQRYLYQNAAPINTVPGAQAASGAASLVFSSANGNGVSIADLDAALNPVEVTLTATNGTLTLATTSGLSFSSGDGSADAAMTFTGTIPAINAALSGMRFSATTFFSGVAGVQIATSDLGNSGPGGTLSDTDNIAIAVAPLGTPYLISGSYVGNALDDRAIAGLGFQPDVVIIKVRDDAKVAVIRTSSMAGDASKEMTGGTALVANAIQSLNADGFTIGTSDTVNKDTKTYDWIAFKASPGWMTVGTYGGNGSASRSISGLGFSPEAVFVMDAGNEEAIFRLAGGANEAYNFNNSNGATVWITSLDADGFTVGNDARVNALTRTYFYIAWNEIPGMMDVGSYTGTGADNRNVTGVGFQPEWMMVKSEGGDHAVQHFDSQGASTDSSLEFASSPFADNRIQALQTNGFQVGSDSDVNGSGRLYSYLAFRQQTKPTLSDVSDQMISEGTATSPLAFTIGDSETLLGSLLIRATSSNQALVPDANIVLNGSGANRTVTLTPVGNLTGTTTITLEVSDGASSSLDTFVLTVAAVNDPPVNTVPAAQSTVLNTPLIFSTAGGNAIVVADSDAGSAAIEVTLSVTSGVLTLSGTGGLAFSAGDGTSDATMTFSGTLASINAALEGLRYDPTANFSGPVLLTITSDDLGNTGSGGAQSTTDQLAINVAYANRAPTLGGANDLTPIDEDAIDNPGTLVSDLIAGQVTDPDANALTGIAVTGADNTNGNWEYSIDGGGSWTAFGAPSLTSARLLAADASTYVRFVPAADWNGTVTNGLTFRAWDRTAGIEGGTADVTVPVTNTVRDGFGAVSYSNNNGTSVWSTGWIDVDGNPSAGNIQISGGQLVFNANLLNGDTIAREVNLNGATGATLSFSYNNSLALLSSVALQVSGNGGASYTTIATFSPTSNAGSNTFSADISGFIAANTRIRFAITGVLLGNTMSVDNVQIAYLTSPFSTASAASDITVNPVNDAPAGTDNVIALLEDTDYTFSRADFGFTDPNDSPANNLLNVVVTSLPTAGTLANNGVAVTAGQSISVADIDAGLLKFTPATDGSGTAYATFTFQIQDDGGTANGGIDLDPLPRTMTVDVTPVNDAPSGTSTTVTTAEDTPYVLTAADFGFTDAVDAPSNALLNVQIVTLPGAGSLTLSGAAVVAGQFVSAADIDAGNLVFTPALNANGAGYAAFTFRVQDDGGTADGGVDLDPVAATLTIDVSAVNDPPVNAVPTIQGTSENVTLTLSSANANAISVSDIDAAGGELEITLVATNGTLTLFDTSGLTFLSGDGTANVVFRGTVAAVNIALDGLQFAPTPAFSGTGSIQIITNDQGNSGAGVALSDDDTVSILINSVNDAPINTVPGPQAMTEDGTLIFTSGNGNAISVADPDAALNPLKVTLSVTNGTLSLSGIAGLAFTTGDGSADASMVFTGTFVDINAALDGLSFTPDADFNGTAQLTLITDDQGASGLGGTQTDTDTIDIAVAGVADTASVTGAATNEDTQSTSGLVITPNAADLGEVTHFKVTGVSGGTLYLNDGVTVISDGAFITVAEGAAGLKFTPTADSIANGGFSVQASVSANDSGLGGGVVAAVITVNPVNDVPILTLGSNPTVTEDAGAQTVAGFASTAPGGGADEAGQTFTYTVSNDNNALFAVQPTIDASGALSYTTAANANGSAVVTVFVTDSGGTANGGVDTSPAQTFTITVAAVNDAPVNTVPGAQSVDEDATLVFASANGNAISVADLEAATVQVTVSVTNGTLSLSGTTGLAFTTGDGAADATMTFSGTVADVNAALEGLTFTPTPDFNGAATLTLTTDDQGQSGSGGTLSDTDTVAITVNAVNDAPVNTVPGAQSVDEDATLVFASANGNAISVADLEAATVQVTVSVTNGTLSLSGTTGLAFTTGDGAADATMTFSGTVADVNAALEGLTFTPTPDFNGAATLTLTTDDQGQSGSGGTLSDTDTVAITVNAVNDAPVNTVPGAQSVDEDATLVFASANGNAISVADLEAATVQVTVSVTNGTLSLSGTTGLAFTTGDGAADATMTFSGTVADVNAALEGLTFTPTPDFNGAATLTLTTDDQGQSGSGGTLSDTDTVAITVNAVNDAPVNTVPGAQSVDEDATLVFASANGNAISVADLEAATVQVTVSVTNGTLSLSGTTGLAFTTGDGAADATMTFSGTVADVNAALEGLTFTPTPDFNGAATLTLTTDDQGQSGSGGTLSDTDTVAITVNAVNDAPVNTVPGAQSVDEDATLVFASANGNAISVADLEAATVQVTVSVTNGTLSLSGTTGLAFTTGDGAADATMTFSGTVADVNAALEGLTFTPTPDFNGAATLTLTTDDQGQSGSGGTLSDTDTVAITVNAVNDAPVNTVPGAQSVDEDATLVFASANGNAISVADLEAATVQVTVSVTNGTLSLSGTTGLAFTTGDGAADATMTFSGTVADVNAALEGLTFTPTPDFNGAATLTLTTDDQGQSGSGGTLSDTDTVAITVNAVNDAPVNTVPGAQSVDEDATLVFASANGNAISVADLEAATVQVTVSVTNGTLSLSGTTGLAFTTGDGAADATMTFSGTVADVNAALEGLTFTPTPDFNGAATLTLTTDDQGQSGSGGTLSDTDTVAITVNAVNDAPVNTVPGAQSVDEDATLVFASANGNAISVADLEAATVQVTVSVTNGTLSLSGTTGLAFTTGDGAADATMTFSGTVADVNAALEGLTFTPTPDFNGAATLTLTTDDQGQSGSGGTLSDTDTVAITVNAVNDAPAAAADGNAVTEDGAAIAGNVLANDSDPEGDALAVTAVNGAPANVGGPVSGTYGTLTLQADGSYTYLLDNALAAVQALRPGDTLNDVFTYRISDGNGGTDSAALTVVISGLNDVAVIGGSTAGSVAEDSAGPDLTIGGALTINDPDAGESNFVVQAGTPGTHGAFAIDAAGNWTYTAPNGQSAIQSLAAGATLTETFTVASADGSAAQTVTITISGVNDAPLASNGAVTLTASTAYVLQPGDFGYADVEGEALAGVRITGMPSTGTLLLDGVPVIAGQSITAADLAAGKLAFALPGAPADVVSATFSFQVSDGTAFSASYTFTINVIPILAGDPGTPPVEPAPASEPPAPPAGTEAPPPVPAPVAVVPPPASTDDTATPDANGNGQTAGSAADALSDIINAAISQQGVHDTDAAFSSGADGESRSATARHAGFLLRTTALDIASFEIAPTVLTSLQSFASEIQNVSGGAQSAGFIQELDRLRDTMKTEAELEQRVVSTAVAIGTGLSVGYVIWLLRGGLLITSLLSSLPAWRFVDPLPILGRLQGEEDEDEESLESIVSSGDRTRTDEENHG